MSISGVARRGQGHVCFGNFCDKLCTYKCFFCVSATVWNSSVYDRFNSPAFIVIFERGEEKIRREEKGLEGRRGEEGRGEEGRSGGEVRE